MKTSSPDTQPSAARRTAEGTVRELVAALAPGNERLVAAMRRSLQKHLPTAHELVYEYKSWFVISYSPNANGYDGVLAIRGDEKGIDLYFNRGKELPDPDKVLRGSAKLVRFVHIESVAMLKRPGVINLMNEAIARTPVPFAVEGIGSIVLRSATAKKTKSRGGP